MPDEFDSELTPSASSRWPTVLGVAALLYGISGLLLNT